MRTNVEISNGELALIISALELAATIMPEAELSDKPAVSAKMADVDRLRIRLMEIANERGLQTS